MSEQNDEAAVPATKNLTNLLEELVALEDQAHMLADPGAAIRAKEREILKAFAGACDEMTVTFAGINEQAQRDLDELQGMLEAAKKELPAIDVDELKGALEAAQKDLEAANGARKAMADEVAALSTNLSKLESRVIEIEGHPALTVPPLDKSAG